MVKQVHPKKPNRLKKWVRMLFFKHKIFVGRYVDILIERHKWLVNNDVIIIGEKWVKNIGQGRKIHKQTIIYVERNRITKWLGFRANIYHFINT